ncbi:hypothetical protein ACS0TY_033767 [Phlomoides rotata]
MVTNIATFEEQMANVMKIIEELTTHVQSQDTQISKIFSNVNNTDTSHAKGKGVDEEHYEAETSVRRQLMEEETILEKLNISFDELVSIDQIKKIMFGTIKDKLGKNTKSSLTYNKSYTKRIDNLKMSTGYQPRNFSSLMVGEIQSSMWPTSSKRAMMLEHFGII